jgi:hypothetical protein
MNRTELARKAKTAAGQMVRAKGYISMVDVLMAMGTLTKENYERWRFRQVPHLEQVLPGSLSKFQFLLRTLRSHARDELRLTPSRTVYTSWGKGRRQPLRFSKYANPYIEELYSTHYVSRKLKQAKLKPQSATLGPEPDQEPRLASAPPQP